MTRFDLLQYGALQDLHTHTTYCDGKNTPREMIKAAMEKLRLSHRSYFFAHSKSLGWDVWDFRYGGIITRTETAIYQLREYLAGRTDRLDELEVERLPFGGKEGIPFYMWHTKVMTPTARILG